MILTKKFEGLVYQLVTTIFIKYDFQLFLSTCFRSLGNPVQLFFQFFSFFFIKKNEIHYSKEPTNIHLALTDLEVYPIFVDIVTEKLIS